MDFSAFLDEINGVISQVWPEIPLPNAKPRQRWTSIQAIRESFVDQATKSNLTLPCVVMKLGQETESEIGIVSGIYSVPLSVYYIAAAGTKQNDLHAKAQALRAVIDNPLTVFTTFQRGENRGKVDSSETSDVNRNLAEIAGVQVVSASVEWNPGLMVFEAYNARS